MIHSGSAPSIFLTYFFVHEANACYFQSCAPYFCQPIEMIFRYSFDECQKYHFSHQQEGTNRIILLGFIFEIKEEKPK